MSINQYIYGHQGQGTSHLAGILFEEIASNFSIDHFLNKCAFHTTLALILFDNNLNFRCASHNMMDYIHQLSTSQFKLLTQSEKEEYINALKIHSSLFIHPSVFKPTSQTSMYPIVSGTDKLGYVAFVNNTDTSYVTVNDKSREHIIFALSTILVKEKILRSNVSSKRELLFEDLLHGTVFSNSELQYKAMEAGLDPEVQYCCCIMCFSHVSNGLQTTNSILLEPHQMQKIFDFWRKKIHANSNCLYKDNFLIFILDSNNFNNLEIETISEHLYFYVMKILADRSNEINLKITMGSPYPSLHNLSTSYQEAIAALRLISNGNEINYAYYFHYILDDMILQSNLANKSLKRLISPLREYDDLNKANLIETLEVYLECNCNVILSSEKLFLHRNTLNYRLQKIIAITGFNASSVTNRINYYLAIKLLRSSNA